MSIFGVWTSNVFFAILLKFRMKNPNFYNKFLLGDNEQVLKKLPANSVDLIVTSPPYADSRSHTYGGISPDKYVEWFLPKAEEFYRVLKPTGTFILNIKERVTDGERHTYVIELILELKKRGWLWTEEYIWHKKNSVPGKWPNRFRDAWERCLQFNKEKKFNIYQDAVMIPMGDWAKTRLKTLSEADVKRIHSKVGSGFGRKLDNWVGRKMAYPTNVLHIPTECGNRNHSAVYPLELPTWFIKLFTKEGDLVMDPFMGSGTTAVAAKNLNRNYLGVEIMEEFVTISNERISKTDTKKAKNNIQNNLIIIPTQASL